MIFKSILKPFKPVSPTIAPIKIIDSGVVQSPTDFVVLIIREGRGILNKSKIKPT